MRLPIPSRETVRAVLESFGEVVDDEGVMVDAYTGERITKDGETVRFSDYL